MSKKSSKPKPKITRGPTSGGLGKGLIEFILDSWKFAVFILIMVLGIAMCSSTEAEKCTAISTSTGQRCKAYAEKNSTFCFNHNPANKTCAGKNTKGEPCRRKARKGELYCATHNPIK